MSAPLSLLAPTADIKLELPALEWNKVSASKSNFHPGVVNFKIAERGDGRSRNGIFVYTCGEKSFFRCASAVGREAGS